MLSFSGGIAMIWEKLFVLFFPTGELRYKRRNDQRKSLYGNDEASTRLTLYLHVFFADFIA